jgi:SsrA-binding protein
MATKKNEEVASHDSTSINRRAYHDYEIEDTLEAGIVLVGTEIKSIRNGKVSLRGAYAKIDKGEIWLESAHIDTYEHGTYYNHDPIRRRKLLLHSKEISQVQYRIEAKGFTLVPLKIYIKHGKAKVLLGIGKGKKLYDKRATIMARDEARQAARYLKQPHL